MAGYGRFYLNDISKTPDKVKYAYRKNVESKLIVWLEIPPKSVITPYLKPSGMTTNQLQFLPIIKKHFEPFIKEYYSTRGYVLWRDLASSHYANLVKYYWKDQKFPFLPIKYEPLNLPKVRQIKDF